MNSEMLAEYALAALSPEEERALEEHLARSAEARAELLELQGALVALAEALPQHAPSAAVWTALEAAFAAETVPPSVSSARPSSPAVLRGPPRRAALYPWLAAACFALFGLGAGVWGAQNFRAARDAQQAQQLVASYLAAPEVRRVALYADQTVLGSVLLTGERALFVLEGAPAAGLAYQAWGHSSSDWEPGSTERLSSLAVSGQPVFEVAPGQFAALYLSVEPRGGSDQPTRPIARMSLLGPVAERPITLLQPASGAVTGERVVVQGLIDGSVADLRYSLNASASRPVPVAGNRFAFTLFDLSPGDNELRLTATLHGGDEVQERVSFTVR